MPKFPTTAKRATLTVLTIFTFLALFTAAACASEDAQPEIDPSRQELLDTIDRMDREMETLRREVEGLRKPAGTVEPKTITREPVKAQSTMQQQCQHRKWQGSPPRVNQEYAEEPPRSRKPSCTVWTSICAKSSPPVRCSESHRSE